MKKNPFSLPRLPKICPSGPQCKRRPFLVMLFIKWKFFLTGRKLREYTSVTVRAGSGDYDFSPPERAPAGLCTLGLW